MQFMPGGESSALWAEWTIGQHSKLSVRNGYHELLAV